MSENVYFCNLPGLMMTKHKLDEGAIEIHEDSRRVILELWNGQSSSLEFRGKEDAEVLRYAAHCVEHFAELEEAEEKNGAPIEPIPADETQIVTGDAATPELNQFALK